MYVAETEVLLNMSKFVIKKKKKIVSGLPSRATVTLAAKM